MIGQNGCCSIRCADFEILTHAGVVRSKISRVVVDSVVLLSSKDFLAYLASATGQWNEFNQQWWEFLKKRKNVL